MGFTPSLAENHDVSLRIDKTWTVLDSIETFDGARCVDIFARPDGSFGFEEFRRDYEDRGAWTPVQFFVGRRFDSREAALDAAVQNVVWLRESLARRR